MMGEAALLVTGSVGYPVCWLHRFGMGKSLSTLRPETPFTALRKEVARRSSFRYSNRQDH
jgi:hypothetical protein